MKPRATSLSWRLRPASDAACAAWLVIAVATVFALLAPLAASLSGRQGVWAAGVAGGVCLFASLGSHWVGALFRGPGQALTGVLFSMLPRMAVPLSFVLMAFYLGGPLVEAGLILYVLVFYLATLAVETWLAVGRADCAAGDA